MLYKHILEKKVPKDLENLAIINKTKTKKKECLISELLQINHFIL